MASQAEVENFYPSLTEFGTETQALLGKFHQSKEADRLTRALKGVAVAGVDLWSIEPRIAGRYFEEIAGLYVQLQRQSGSRFVLTPSETDWIYQKFYPDRPTYTFYDLYKMLYGITVPDGLIFQQGKRYLQLTGVCEYTAQNNIARNTQKQAQLERYQQPAKIAEDLGIHEADSTDNAFQYSQGLRELLKSIRPDIPHDLPISCSSSWEIIYALPATSDKNRGHLPYLPFNGKEFNRYIVQLINRIICQYQLGVAQSDDSNSHISDTTPLSALNLSALWPKTIAPRKSVELYRRILALV